MQDKITLAIDALASAAFIEGGVSPENTQAARDLTELRKGELLAAIGAPCLHQIQEPATNKLLEAKPAFYTAIAENDGDWIPLPEYSAQTSDGVLQRVLERAREEGYQGGNALERLKELGWAYRPVYFAVDPAQVAPLPLLIRDIARDLAITSTEVCQALKDLGNFSVNTAVTAEMAAKLRELFPVPQAAPEAVAVPAAVMGLLEALESMVDVCEGHDFDGAPSDGHMAKARAAISTYHAALAATPTAAPVALTIPQPFGYVVTTPAGADLFYRHPADLAIHNDHRAETVYTLPAVLAAAPVVLPEPDAWRDGARFALEAVSKVDSICWLTDSMKVICIKNAADAVIAERDRQRALLATATGLSAQAFQQRVQPWMMACFGPEISADSRERNHRFLEEALELVQCLGCTASEAHQLVDYVYGRPWGEPAQEVGGVMVTLAAVCLAQGLDMHAAGETELARIWTKVEAIRAKQAAKPKHSPLPMHVAQADARDAESDYQRGYRHGYNRRDAEVQGALL